MKFTLSWLKDYLDTDASAEEIAEALTHLGLELEELSNPAEKLKPFVIASVVEARQHPNADRLRVCMVDTGTRRAGPGRLRRAECAHRHEGRLRAARHAHPRHRHRPEGRHDPRRGVERHAPVGARARPLRRA